MKKMPLMTYLKKIKLISPKSYSIPSDKTIELKLDTFSYEGYIPKKVFYAIICGATYRDTVKFNIPKRKLKDAFNTLLYELVSTLPYGIYSGSPLEKAIRVLKDLKDKVNFRSLEEGIIDYENINTNGYKILPNELEGDTVKEYLLTKDLDNYNINDVIALINFTKSKDKKKSVSASKTMRTYSDITKIDYSQMSTPLFNYKLATKTLRCRSKSEKANYSKVIVVDTSFSMVAYRIYINVLILHIQENHPDIRIFSINSTGTKDVTDLDSIRFVSGALFNFDKEVLKLCDNLQDTDELTIFTDNEDKLKLSRFKGVINVITPKENEHARNLCDTHHGKYLYLKNARKES